MSFEEKDRIVDLTQEPRKVFINFLIYNMKAIEEQIFFNGKCGHAIKSMRGLIKSLDEKSHQALEEELKKLKVFAETGGFNYQDVENIYQSLCAYLHKTYLKEVSFATPRYPSDKIEVPKE